MKNTLFSAAIAATVVLAAATVAWAQGDMIDAAQDAPADVALDCCCCSSGAWIFGAEATFFKFHDAGGVEDEEFNDGSFDYEVSPRITLGYVGCDGLGARVRWWDYDHNTSSNNDEVIGVDTYNIDFEIFQEVDLGCCTSLELSAGIRYNDFEHVRGEAGNPPERVQFDGIGGMVALEVRRELNCGLGVYARLREAIMMGDAVHSDGDDENDTTHPVTEIALGAYYNHCNWAFHAGVEWQNWGSYTSRNEDTIGGIVEDTVTDQDDIGFFGFVFGGELTY